MTALAELPTAQAAEAFAAYGQFGEFESLFLRIEAAGFPLGVEGRLRCYVVLSRLTSLGVKPDAAQLHDYLVPILAASAHQQHSIRRAIQDWADPGAVRAVEAVLVQAAGKTAAPRRAGELERTDRGGKILAAGLFGVALIAVAALITASVWSGTSPGVVSGTTSVLTNSQPIFSLDAGLHPFWKKLIEDALSRLGFAAVVLLAGLSFVAWRNEVKGRLVRRNEETDLIETFGLKARIPDWFRSADARAAFDRLKRVRLFDTDFIDVARTVARSTRAGGLPIVVTKRLRELPNYVLLVDRAGLDDLEGIFARAVEAALMDARIVYSRYDFAGSLDRLNPVRGGAQEDIVDAEYLPFSVIASRHAGERLILIGTGTRFFEVPGFRYDRVLKRRTLVRPGTPVPQTIHLREFSAAFLITPAPESSWGENEWNLYGLGFEVVSADVGGVQRLAAQLMSEPDTDVWIGPRSRTDEDEFLAGLDRDAMRLSAAVPPPRAEIDRLVTNLKVWSHEPRVFAVLAAIAAFPKIDPAFTFVLAEMVLEQEMDSALFARLVRLPWIRKGYMPDWLRIAIINGLDPEQRRSVQAVQMAMLKGTEQKQEQAEAPDGTLSWRDQLVANFKVARELPRGKLDALISRIQPREVLSAEERIFFSVLRDYRLDPEMDVIAPEAPEIVADMIDAPERKRRAQIRLAVIGLAAMAALLQPWIFIGLTMVGQGAVAGLRAMGSVYPAVLVSIYPAIVLHAAPAIGLLVAMALWFVNANRREPLIFRPLSFLRWPLPPLRHLVRDPQPAAFYALLVAPLGLIIAAKPGSANADFVTVVILALSACAVLAWVWLVTPERWWNAQCANDKLEMQVARDPVTAALGALLVVAIWAVPWFLSVLPVIADTDSAPRGLFRAACIGAVSLVAGNALARRWLIGVAATGALYRLWMDAGFALVVFLIAAALYRVLAPYLMPSSLVLLVAVLIVVAAAYAVQLKATLGLRMTRPVWGFLINGAVVAVTVGWAIVTGIALRYWSAEEYLSVLPSMLAGGLAYGAVTAFQFRRSDYSGGSAMVLWVKCVVFGMVFFGLGASLGHALSGGVIPLLNFAADARDHNLFQLLTWFVLPAALAVWPMFRVLAPTLRIVEPQPLWRAIVKSPWWGTLAMWLAGMVWHVSASLTPLWPFSTAVSDATVAFSVWPLALLIAIALRLRHGAQADVPIAFGTLPLLVRIGDINVALYTPGGVWPAFAILLLARFAADTTFRQRCLRREHLSWPEALLIVALLSVKLDIALPTSFMPGIPASISIEPSWMFTAAAAVIGASRMPASRFAVALIALWLMTAIPAIFDGPAARPWVSIGLSPGELASLLLVLYCARAWRTYAASGAGTSPRDPITGSIDRRLMQMKNHGIWLAYATTIAVAILASSLVPAVELLRINWVFVPSTAGALALVLFTGLVAGNLWLDRVVFAGPLVRRWPQLFRLIERWFPWRARFAYATAGAALMYVAFAAGAGREAFSEFGIGTKPVDALPADLGVIGFAACVIGYLAFSIAMRIVAEKREGETWRDSAHRLWTAPVREDEAPPDAGAPDLGQPIPWQPEVLSKRPVPA